MARHRYIWNRGGYYYFRMPVPKKFISQIGMGTLSCSLRTKSLHIAKYRASKLKEITDYVFMRMDTGLKLTPDEIKRIVKQYFDEAMERLEAQMDKYDHEVTVFTTALE